MGRAESVNVDSARLGSAISKRTIMRIMLSLLMAGTAGVLLEVGAACADTQPMIFRPAIDGIGNAYSPASESAGIPDGADFSPGQSEGAPAGRGKVTIDSVATPLAQHRRRWPISR